LFSTSDAETAWLSCIAGFHTSILVFATYIGLGQKTNALAQRCNASRGQQAVGVDHRSVDLNPSTKKPPPARRTLERLRDIMGEDDDAISLASEQQIDTLNKLAVRLQNASDRLQRHRLRLSVGGTGGHILGPFPSAENRIHLSQI
jgi:hypothetical protein